MKKSNLIFAILCLLGLASCQPANNPKEPTTVVRQSTTLYLIRHAEKDTTIKGNPPLTEIGEQRAERLAYFLSEAKIEAIYSSGFLRTKETVRPLSQKTNIPIQEYDVKKPIAPFIQDLLEAHPNQRVVIVGHSNTIPKMLNALLGQAQFEDLEDDAYDYIFQVIVRGAEDVEIVTYKMQAE